ncbi:hypothetical protein [uncultured Lacinutrix sp.]|uniref:hypothetical protein n=1 Tax=uncultured Lacinutrix sp. TaxID=574032 RepID=UPI00262EF1CE|nr:hypothetical protein [uncultured Lacinutrix sp.]
MKKSNSAKKLPFFFIGKETTEKRKENFIRKKHPVLCKELGKVETKSIWYTREHIAKLLEEIDYANGNGITLHFGAYEKGHEFEDQLCLVMNITRINVNGKVSFQENVVLENESDFADRSKNDRLQQSPNEKNIKRDFNFGSPCPPRCDQSIDNDSN